MGILDSLFGKKNNTENLAEEMKKYKQLLHFISFVKKIKPLTGGNQGIFITYEAPKPGEYISSLQATFNFCDFKEIKFAREYATGASVAPGNMVKFYYDEISKRAGLTQQDWPYAIDEFDFAEVLRGEFVNDFFTLIPDKCNDDVYKFRVVGGADTRNAGIVSNVVIKLLASHFSELKISKNHTTPYSMGINIQF